jgi:hypothetical protein
MIARSTMLVGGAAVAAVVVYLWWRSRQPIPLTPVEIIRAGGKPATLKPTAGLKMNPIAGGSGDLGSPTGTKTVIKPRTGGKRVTTIAVNRKQTA